jgi:hypothetical protein
MTKTEQLDKFIKDNELKFTEGRRNSDLVVLCGYALYIGADQDDVFIAIPEDVCDEELMNESDRVWEYAEANNYGNWWQIEANRKTYKL